MADLSINLAGIKSPNPFWLASAPPTNSGYQVMRAFEAGWGGAVWKTLGDPIVNVTLALRGSELGDRSMVGHEQHRADHRPRRWRTTCARFVRSNGRFRTGPWLHR